MRNKLLLFLATLISSLASNLEAVNMQTLREIVATTSNPFDYDLHFTLLPNEKVDAELLICMHGMGSDYTLAELLKMNPVIPYHIVSFNFPDHGLLGNNVMQTKFGTFDEVAPALFVLRRCVVDGGANKVHLYGFSAGGGAIINILAILNSNSFDNSLQKIGIGDQEKQKILQSIQQGSVILEVPLKSFDEIADLYGGRETQFLAQRAQINGMTPIQNLHKLQGLSLNCFLYFANPDKVLGNRDDKKFIQLLEDANKNGRTIAIIGRTAGHTNYHPELWSSYQKFVDSRTQ